MRRAAGCGVAAVLWSAATGVIGAEPAFVGSASCAGCHVEETALWRGSHHDRAMQEASAETVLGDFAGAVITKDGVTSRFYRKNDGFFVETDGPDGVLRDYRIDYTFGVYPLQQYLIAFPGGRWQALGIAWDARSAAEGGQRWFHLYPDEQVPHGDELHWTGANQNWNWMCADCHSTGVRRGYDLATDSYRTTWAALNVACEACHGPGAAHVAWAAAGAAATDPAMGLTVRLRDRGESQWRLAEGARIAERATPRATSTDIEVCAPCHARRAPLGDGRLIGAPLLDFHRLQLLDPGVYHADGQIDGEVFEYGSFLQSRMYRAGVTCSDCHEPHSLRLRAEGNAVCAQCHRGEAFDTAAHHFHAPGEPGGRCVDCHMPAKTYMVVDPRHDHAFKIPRPDLSAASGAPDACTGCHVGRDPPWAAARIAEWYGPDRRREPSFGEALGALRAGAPDALARLVALADDADQPAIARATAIAALGGALDQRSYPAATRGLADPDPLVRLAAVGTLATADLRQTAPLLLPLLDDPVRAVRLEAARVLAPLDETALPPAQRMRLEAGFDAYEAAQSELVERAAGLVTLANFYRDRRRLSDAEKRLRDSIRLHPRFVPAYANLADLLREAGRDAAGGAVLEAGLAVVPDAADLHHARGLWLVRRERYSEAVAAFGKAATLAPENPWYAYLHAVALEEIGRGEEALDVLRRAYRRHPRDPDILLALAAALLERDDRAGARRLIETLLRIAPGHPSAEALRQAIDGGGR